MRILPARLRDVSVTKKLYFIVGTMAVLIAFELVTLWFSMQTLSSVRAFVGGEGLWSKSQKDASSHLREYNLTRDEQHYEAFKSFMKVPLGDHKTLVELSKAQPDLAVARQGFLEGRIHEDDIDGMINLIRRFHSISYIHDAVNIWAQADSIIGQLIPLGERMHEEIQRPQPSQQVLDSLQSQINPINAKLTVLEDEFSYVLGAGSRWLEDIVLRLLLIVALTVEISGLLMSIGVSRGISRGLDAIIRAAKRVSMGDLRDRATVYSNDEIGQVATAMNMMTEHLVLRNKDLEQFAYIISHNLRGPMTNVLALAAILDEEDLDDGTKKECVAGMVFSVHKLDETLTDLTRVLQMKHEAKELTEYVRFNDLVRDITASISDLVQREGAVFITDFSATEGIVTIKSYMYSIFHNLILNAIKYKRLDAPPRMAIRSSLIDGRVRLTFSDNGLGIDLKRQGDKIFGLYKRFHVHVEGKGMGLFMVKSQVEALGGRVNVESEVGVGTIFTIDL